MILGANIPPFEYQGKTACRVLVWTNDGGKTQVISHLSRYTPLGRQRLLEQRRKNATPDGDVVTALNESVAKHSGEPDTAWTRSSDPRFRAVTAARRNSSAWTYSITIYSPETTSS